ncbi:MAG: sodium-dependent bicarbonate transport family permease [Planctomycetes bacterium]|nr:sodium-dependent bicarbonate transport family permease [Planctomycetota bacterium]
MDFSHLLSNLQNPPILFFGLGVLAALVRSPLEIPAPVSKLLALYLLWAIGFKGGVELAHGGLGGTVLPALGAAVLLAALAPLPVFALARRRLSVHDATALAAAYGSISAVTFLTACAGLERQGIGYGGHMVAAMALMESPAIVVAVLLRQRLLARQGSDAAPTSTKALLHDALLNGPVVLLLGSLIIGALCGDSGYQAMKPLCKDAFPGVLVFFLLDLGVLAGGRMRQLAAHARFLLPFGVIVPLLQVTVALPLAALIGMSVGDATLLAVLAASASYIAVPAAMRLAVPEAEASVYVGAALGITFPFNIVIGLPVYQAAATWILT